MKFVMDTSKYWFKPSITRDQGKAVSVSAGLTPSQTRSLWVCRTAACSPGWNLPPCSTSVQLLPVLRSCGDSVMAIQSILGFMGIERPTHRSRGRAQGRAVPQPPHTSVPEKLLLPLTVLLLRMAWAGADFVLGTTDPQHRAGAPQSAGALQSVPARGTCVSSANAPDDFSLLARSDSPRKHRPDTKCNAGRFHLFCLAEPPPVL